MKATASSRNIGSELRRAREASGLSQRAVAALMGLNPNTLCQFETGVRMFRESYLPLLPEEIREAVRQALVDEHMTAVDRLWGGE